MVSPTVPPLSAVETSAQVACQFIGNWDVNVYAAPDNGSVLTTLKCGGQVTILARNTTGAIWPMDRVRTEEGRDGYVFDRYLEPVPTPPPVNANPVLTGSGPQALPALELSKLRGSARLAPNGVLAVNLYNGTSWDVSELTVRVTVIQRRKGTWTGVLSRAYRLVYACGRIEDQPSRVTYYPVTTPPLSVQDYCADLGFALQRNEKFTWDIVSASGTEAQ